MAWLTKSTAPENDPVDPQLELAARELQRLKPDDLQRVIKLLNALKVKGGE